ncbi:DUF2382 domain-containing protein [Planococcus sp. CP5-4]|uniref:DUF2382 domain-containing protein n=1 Tax=unclassified Planococcus (in: firmicutes) TaxID=2662419 RepID=UPI001C210314|nr:MULTISPECIES: DUF2382 domain-containing protein [unclassified Planococcus (in: firmicutes)]MBU9673296.1 DUF2382 domain-containing protein [Planococcus sp. CP5-4_YE]MBV0908390.1 DUF2382 domain-containing protein [Planococcus sp. CP5-4_UN]MBW6062604.1 DUF2382 domain-containing protein [Planococcus sp. CP5-4]
MQKHGHKLIGTFDVQAEVIHEIGELKAQGYKEEDIYVVALNGQQLQMVQGQTDVHLNTDENDFMDKFKSFISGEDPTKDALKQMGLSDSEADEYYNQIQSGKIILYVDSEYGMNYQNFDAAAASLSGTGHAKEDRKKTETPDLSDEQQMKLHEERLAVDKNWVESGSVDIHKNTVEEQQTFEVPYEREEVEIERRPVNQELAAYEASGHSAETYEKDGLWHIPVIEERLEVRKVKYVSEEIIVHKRKIQETKHISETVQRETVDIDEHNVQRHEKP